jgi:DNA polymerase-3 subunit delta'
MTDALPPLLGHADVLRGLTDALDADRLHHALLLEGAEGSGRRLVAQRLALYSSCEAPGGRPCGQCGACRRILAGTHPDVILIAPDADSASGQISVDRVRDLVRAAILHRYSAPRRFIVIDPAEALPTSAANALLKTLEEPNPGTHFCLIARHAQGLLPTIVSRCQRVRLAPVPEDALVAWLEARGVPDARAAARLSGGSPGRALAWSDGELAARRALRDELLAALGGDLERLMRFAETVTEGSRAESRGAVQSALAVVEDLLRDAALTASNRADRVLDLDAAPVTAAWAAALWPGGLTTCAQHLADARAQLAINVTPRTAVEALLAKLATELGSARRVSVPAAG